MFRKAEGIIQGYAIHRTASRDGGCQDEVNAVPYCQVYCGREVMVGRSWSLVVTLKFQP